ncbi:alpha-N-acetylglucosaminidase [Streptomyces sp. N35]|uniref:alpha-N-acetylglucosaminidase n=1 Tax=Streptomyces sp. N35 TaxID=2795730 RepID=UPI0027DE6620|nr:alpha-N-acetylglucosaminidase [Streptomyces sp. N35]
MTELPLPLPRRTVLGAAAALGAGHALGAAAPAAAAEHERAFDIRPARAALERLLPHHADQFRLTPLRADTDGRERFRVTGRSGRIEVAATTPATLLTGVHWYLKYVCQAHISWAGSRTDHLPHRLPAPDRPLDGSTTLAHRFALNDTNDGYTAPYADWAHWERLIDVLALHGCNEVLVIAGQEAVYHRLLQEFGYSDTEARAWIPAPSHQPWWLLQNMSRYGGPLSPELLRKRIELGQRITSRLRELGMAPVLPGYFGTVPEGFAARNPGAVTVPQGTWCGFTRPDWLDPRTPLFEDVAASFYRHQRELFGEAAHFKIDLLHEGGTAGNVPVPDAARAVEKALHKARPDATWVILGWLSNPRRDLLDAVDKDRMLIVDGVSDRFTPAPDREDGWGGVPYTFGSIPNYGGRNSLGANTERWAERFWAWRDKPGSKLVGTAYMPEAAQRDPAAFELFSELAWRDKPVDLSAWFAAYADLRYGGRDTHARTAWAGLRGSVYKHTLPQDIDQADSLFNARPSLTAAQAASWSPLSIPYDTTELDRALDHLLDVKGGLRGSDAYRYDLVDITRQALANRARLLLPQLNDAHQRKDLAGFRSLAATWIRLMRLQDEMTATHRAFLLGPWLDAAKRSAHTDAEAAELERTARVLITTWGDRPQADGGSLHEYANRDWSGLIADFYLPRWQRYLDEVEDALVEGRAPAAIDWYAMEEEWTRRRQAYPLRASGDPHRTARRVRDALAATPFQATLAVTAEPRTLGPETSAAITATFANRNGFAAAGKLDIALTSPTRTETQGPAESASVPPGGAFTARWKATAPASDLTDPLTTVPFTVTATYEPRRGATRAKAVHQGSLYLAGPLDEGLTTVDRNAAVFGQLGDRYAIEGAGSDLWGATAQFGAIRRAAAMGETSVVTTRVDSQANTGNWARSGIIVSNDLTAPGSLGFLNLAVTPANGVVLSYDADGNGQLDKVAQVTGVRTPVTLRLTRDGTTYIGEFSTDGGGTWRAVAKVTVPGATGRQDVGLFMTAANAGRGTRGLTEFTGFQVR